MDQEQDRLTIEEAAFVLKVGISTIESLINRGLLVVDEADGQRTVNRGDLLDLMRRNQQELDYREPNELGQDFGVMGKRTDE